MACRKDIEKIILDEVDQIFIDGRHTYYRLDDNTFRIANTAESAGKSKAKTRNQAREIALSLRQSIINKYGNNIFVQVSLPEESWLPIELTVTPTPQYIEKLYAQVKPEKRTEYVSREAFLQDEALYQQELREDEPLNMIPYEAWAAQNRAPNPIINEAGVPMFDPSVSENNLLPPQITEKGQYQLFKESDLETTEVTQVKKNILENLPIDIAKAVTVVNNVPLEILGSRRIEFSMQSLLENTDIIDPILINWLGINKAVVNVRAVKSTEQLNSIITKSYNQRIQQAKPFLKKAAEVQFNEWVNELQKYPIAFGDAILKYAIKNLINPKRRNKFVISFSETALSNTFRDVTNQPHKLNQVGSIYNSELLKLTSDATEHEPSASGKGYWVHVPRVEKKSDFNTYDRFELNGNSYTKIDTYRKNEKEISKEEYNKAIEDYKKQTPDINAQYKANVELLRKLSPQTWCTASTMADYYVQNYDNYLLIVDGKTVAGIEAGIDNRSSQQLHGTKVFYLLKSDGYLKDGYAIYSNRKEEFDDKTLITNETTKNPSGVEFTYVNLKKEDRKIPVKEVTSIANNGIAPVDHLDDILAFFEKHNLDPNTSSVQNAIKAKENGKTDKDLFYDEEQEARIAHNLYWEERDREERIAIDMFNGEYEYEPDWDAEYRAQEAAYFVDMEQGEQRARELQTTEEALDYLRGEGYYIAFEEMSEELRSTKEVAEAAIEQNTHNIAFVPNDLPFYKELAHKAVQKNAWAYDYISEEAKAEERNIIIHNQYLQQRGDIVDDLPFSQTKDAKIQGYYDPKTDKVVVVASNTPVNEGAKVAIHEVAHRGMLRMAKDLGGVDELYSALSAAKSELMKKLPELLKRTGHKNLESLMLDYGFVRDSKEGEFKLLSELAARWAETLVGKPLPSWWKRFLESIKSWIKKFTGQVLTEEQVNSLVGGFVRYGTIKNKRTFNEEIQYSQKQMLIRNTPITQVPDVMATIIYQNQNCK